MHNKLTKTAENALSNAVKYARKMGHTYVGTEHVLLGLLSEKNCIASKILVSRSIDQSTVNDMIEEMCGFGENTQVTLADLTPGAKSLLEGASFEAVKHNTPCVGTEHILLSMITESDCTGCRLIIAHGVKLSELYTDVMAFIDNGEQDRFVLVKDKKIRSNLKDTPTLKQYGKNLNEEARLGKFDPVIGRDEEMQRVIQVLSRRNKNNPCLVGKAGVGKTAIAEGLASRIVCGDVPSDLEGKVIFSVDMSALLAGAKYRGEFEDRMKNIMAEVAKNPCIILFIDELHTIVGAGAAEGAIDAANILKPALARGEMQIIGASTPDEYRKSVEKDSALERRFQPVDISEPTAQKTLDILHGIKTKYEQHHGVKISDGALSAAVELSSRYITERCFPDKAIDLIDEACSRKRVAYLTVPEELKKEEDHLYLLGKEKEEAILNRDYEKACKIREKEKALSLSLEEKKLAHRKAIKKEVLTVTEDDIAKVVTGITRIPTGRLLEGEGEYLRMLQKHLNEKIIGQADAVNAVCRAVLRSRIGIKDPSKPCSFIFTGPTGVGKTMLCKELASYLFSGKRSFIKFDMSEYMEAHSVSGLIGAPMGYSGCEEGGRLTEAVRRNPYSVVVFDEIEKAHPDVFNLFLQILDEGKLTDSAGVQVNFKNCIIIMTSNAGFEKGSADKSFGFASDRCENAEKNAHDNLKKIFTSELLNRVDEIAVFRRLQISDCYRIAETMLQETVQRCKTIGVEVVYSENVPLAIADFGGISEYGARKLKRTIQKEIEDNIAILLLDKNVNKISVTSENGEIFVKAVNRTYHETKC